MLEYILHHEGRLFNEQGRSFIITHNLKGKNINDWEKQFIENEKYRKQKRKDSVFAFHDIISWHKDDAKNLSLEKMQDMAREYINLRNPNGMYIVTPHFNRQHFHLHVAASGVEYRTGKSLRLSKPELVKVKRGIQSYQIEKYPELSHSIVQHGKKVKSLQTEKEYQYKRRTSRETDKSQLTGILETSFKKSLSKTGFFEKLTLLDVSTYSRNGKITGVIFKNRKFRFSRLGFDIGRLDELDKSTERGRELIKSRERRGKNIERNI